MFEESSRKLIDTYYSSPYRIVLLRLPNPSVQIIPNRLFEDQSVLANELKIHIVNMNTNESVWCSVKDSISVFNFSSADIPQEVETDTCKLCGKTDQTVGPYSLPQYREDEFYYDLWYFHEDCLQTIQNLLNKITLNNPELFISTEL